MDERPKLAAIFSRLLAGEGPLWLSWKGKRFLLARVEESWLERGVGVVIVATRRGYRRMELVGRSSDSGFAITKRGKEKHQALRSENDYFSPVADKRIRAIVLEEHEP